MFLLCIILIRRIVCRVLEKLVVVDHGLKRLCMELKTVIDRVLKMNDWVLNMEKDKGVYLGNQYLECYWYLYLEWHCGKHRIRIRSQREWKWVI